MSTLHARIAMIAFAVLAAFAAGCGGGGGVSGLTTGGGGSGGNGGGSGSKSLTGFYLHIVIPATGGSAQSNRRRPKYISSATAQLAYSVDGTVETPIALTTANPDCSGSPVSCTVPIAVAPGAHTFSFTLEDSSGNPLSGATNVSYTVVAGNANTLSVTLGGIVASIAIQSQTANGNRVTGNVSNGFQIYGNSSVQFAIVEEDADGNTIVGAMPSPSVQPSSGAPYTIATPSSGSNIWTLTSTYQATNPGNSSNTSMTVVASPVPSSGPTSVFQTTVGLQLYQPWIFVLNSGAGGSVTAYDEQGNTKTLPAYAVSTPQGIAVDNSSDTNAGDIYVTNVASVKTFVIATAAPTTLPGSFSGIASPGPIVFDTHNEQLYLANLASSGQTMEAYTSGGAAGGGFSTTTNIANPTALAFDSVDNFIFLASGTGNKVYEFNEAGAQQTSWTTSLSNPSGLAYDPNWGWIFVANKGSGAITAYNSSGISQTLSGFTGLTTPTAMLFDPHSKTFYVVNGSTMKAFTESSTTGTVTSTSLSGSFSGMNTPTEILIIP